MAKIAIEGAKRATAFLIDPANLVITTNKKSATFDNRAKLPVDPALVQSIRTRGWLNNKPALVRKDGNKLEVVDGRQRTRAAVEANKLRVADGLDPIMACVTLAKTDDVGVMELLVVSNAMNQQDTVIESARKAQRLLDAGLSEERVAETFGVSTATIKNWRTFLTDCHADVQKAVEAGQISMTDAIKSLAKLAREEQVKALADIETSGTSARQAGESHGAPKARKRRGLGRKDIKQMLTDCPTAFNKRETLLLNWIIGKVTRGTVVEQFPELSA
jgi:ParB/RepB/Spo0J family partition protein